MAFEFIGHADSVAKNQYIWGIALLIGSALLGFYTISKGKSGVYWIGVAALLVAAMVFFYQWMQLKSSPGDWVIRANDDTISWQSPNEKIDRSFAINLSEIDYIDRSAMPSPSDDRRVYHLVLKNDDAIKLNPVSGIDIEALVASLQTTGLKVKETDQYYLPVELRNK